MRLTTKDVVTAFSRPGIASNLLLQFNCGGRFCPAYLASPVLSCRTPPGNNHSPTLPLRSTSAGLGDSSPRYEYACFCVFSGMSAVHLCGSLGYLLCSPWWSMSWFRSKYPTLITSSHVRIPSIAGPSSALHDGPGLFSAADRQ